MILKTKLHDKNKITAIGAFDIPLFLRCTLGVIHSRLEEIKN
jgi:hypothetical protein